MKTRQGRFHMEASEIPDPGILNPQIEQSFRQLPISLAVNLVNGLILVVVLWDAASAPVLLIWLVLLVAVTGTRFLTMRAFRKEPPGSRRNHGIWARYFVAGACASGLVWGAAGVFLFHPSSFPHQVFLAFVLGGMVAGAVPLLSSVDHAYWFFAIPAVVPISMQMLLLGDPIHLIMGLMTAIFGIAMLSSATQVHHLYRDMENLRGKLLSSIKRSHSLEHMVRMDPLTQIPNRLLFEEELRKEWG